MKKRFKILSFVLLLSSNLTVIAATNVTANAVASVSILQVLQLAKVTDMSFGKIIAGSPGYVYLTTTGGRTSVGTTIAGESGWYPARFDVRGGNDYDYYIALPSSLILRNGSGELRVEELVAKPSTSPVDATIGKIKSDSYFTIGGKLIVPEDEIPTGNYSTSFEVSIGYN